MTEPLPIDAKASGPLTLGKGYKLRHRTLVNGLFQEGRSVYAGPLRITFRKLSSDELKASFREGVPDRMGPLQFMVTVPKKKRRHAVDRVLMRRRIREAFRLHNRELRTMVEADAEIRTLSMAFVYMQSENLPMSAIEDAVVAALAKIRKRLRSQPQAEQDC